MLGMPAKRGVRGVRDRLQRVGAAGVVSQRIVGKVQLQRFGVVDHVLDHGAKAVGGGVDFRLGFGVEVDGLGVAAAFEVEDAAVGPAMLVITDQGAVGVGRKGGLAGD